MVLYGNGRVIRQRLPSLVCRDAKLSASALSSLRTGVVRSVSGWMYVPDAVRVSYKANCSDVARYMKVFNTGTARRMLVTNGTDVIIADSLSLCYVLRGDYKVSALRLSVYGLREVLLSDMHSGIVGNTWFDADGVQTVNRMRAVHSIDTIDLGGMFSFEGTLKVRVE